MRGIEEISVFGLGTAVGSFINVLVSRFQEKGRIDLLGRSRCDHCQRQLEWWENIPLISFLLLRGQCRTCHSPIPWEYFLVELTTGFIYLFLFIHNNYSLLTSKWQWTLLLGLANRLLIVALLIVVFLFDFHYQIIPDWATLILLSLALLYHQIFISGSSLLTHFFIGLISASLFLFLHLITRGKGMGLGDVKFALFMGFFLGPSKTVLAFYLAFLTGALVGVILILVGKKRFGQQIAFGPFLVGGTFVSWLGGDGLIKLLLRCCLSF